MHETYGYIKGMPVLTEMPNGQAGCGDLNINKAYSLYIVYDKSSCSWVVYPYEVGKTPLDIDGDGTPNATDTDTDGDTVPNTTDTDDDNDGNPDLTDPSPTGL